MSAKKRMGRRVAMAEATMSASKLAEIAEFEGGAWDSPIDVDHFKWSFRWLPASVLLRALSKPRWKEWLDEEPRHLGSVEGHVLRSVPEYRR
jgi:hypothetical protein